MYVAKTKALISCEVSLFYFVSHATLVREELASFLLISTFV